MKVSVIVPVFNVNEKYLAKCLWSLTHQKGLFSTEVIVVDDGSTNGCDRIIRKFASSFPSIKSIRQENQGTSVARNAGLDAARGDYVMFVDGDDYIAPDCLERVIERMDENPVDILFFGYATAYQNRKVRRVLEDYDPSIWERETLERSVLEGNPAFGPVEVGSPWGKLIRRGAIESPLHLKRTDASGTNMSLSARYQPGLKKGQDTVFILNLLERCSSFAYFPYLGYYYRVSAGSVSKRYQPDIVPTMERMLSAYRTFADSFQKDERYSKAVERKYCKVVLGEYLELRFLHPDNREPMEKRIGDFRRLIHSDPYEKAIRDCDPTKAGAYWRLQFSLLKGNRIRALFYLKMLEMKARDLAARKYG
ncbi:MAG: glycosyltransferase [Lachnospiraceae bacterium]|nr:glycosyltransferase [Lachnospiraceae bacterium]